MRGRALNPRVTYFKWKSYLVNQEKEVRHWNEIVEVT